MGCRHSASADGNLTEISKRIKKLREDSNETQEKLATAINVTKFTIANIEQGKSSPSLDTIVRIASHYNVSVDFICGLSDDTAFPLALLDTICRYISLEISPVRMGDFPTHEMPIIVIKKCVFDYLKVLAKAAQLKKKDIPDEVIDAWCEKEGKKAANLLQHGSNKDSVENDTVKYAVLSSRYISSDKVLGLLEQAYNESFGDDGPL